MKSITIQPLANANLVRKQWQQHLDWMDRGSTAVMSAAFQRKWCTKCHGRFPDWRDRAKNQTWKPPERRKRVWSLCSSGSWWFHVRQSAIENATRKCRAIFFCRRIIRPSFFKNLQGPFPLLSLLASGDGGIKHYEVLLNSPSREPMIKNKNNALRP